MGKKKSKPAPLLAHKHAFVESLDATVQAAVTLNSKISVLLAKGDIPEPSRGLLEEALAEFTATIFTED